MLDPTQFEYLESRWQDLYIHLQDSGFEVYSPGMKVGECTSPYLVIKHDGSIKHDTFSTDLDLYSIMVYVPRNEYSKLEVLMQQVKSSMKEIYPLFVYYGEQTSSYYDDNFKAHMISIEYRNAKKL